MSDLVPGDPFEFFVANRSALALYDRDDVGVELAAKLPLGVGDNGNSRGAVWGDFDNDGWLDLFVTNRGSENKIFRNIDGNSQFEEVGERFGINTSADSRGVALADFDRDGGRKHADCLRDRHPGQINIADRGVYGHCPALINGDSDL